MKTYDIEVQRLKSARHFKGLIEIGMEALVLPLESAAVAASEELAVCLVERPRRQADLDTDLLQQLEQQVSQAPLPVRVVIVDTGWLPRTSSGKISRFRARQKYADVAL